MSKGQKDLEEAPERAAKPTSLAPPKRYTVQALVALVGMVAVAKVLTYVRGFVQAVLIKRGAKVATSRVAEDGAQIVGQAAEFMARATPTQRRLLATVTPAFLAAAATGLYTAAELDAKVSRRRAKGKVGRKAAKAAEGAVLPAARARRQLFCTHLIAMAGGESAWVTRVQDACAAAPDGAALARSIDTMVTEGRALAAHVAAQGGDVTVDDAYFTEMTELAEAVRAASHEVASVTPDASAQAELDWWDGVNLWFLGTLVDNFAQAHKVDARVPRLPLGGLKSVLKPGLTRARKPASAPKPPPAPVPA